MGGRRCCCFAQLLPPLSPLEKLELHLAEMLSSSFPTPLPAGSAGDQYPGRAAPALLRERDSQHLGSKALL